MRIWETSEQFPFRTLRSLGVVILLHGIILIVLGIFDVVWTIVKYTDAYDECPTSWPEIMENPCDHDELVWTWIAEGVWGGFLILLVGVLGTLFSRMRVKNLRFQRDMFGVGSILLGFPICPAIIVCSVLELYYDDKIFYYMDGNELNTEDIAKFVVPLLVAIFAFLAWVVAIAAAAVACCASVDVTEKAQPRPMVMAQQPQMIMQAPQQAQQPIIIQAPAQPQPTPQPMFEVVPIPQAAPPPYYVMGPPMGGPMGPHMGGPMGPPMGGPMGPPPFGPMGPPPFGPMGPPPFGPMGPPFGRPHLPAIMPPESYM